MNNNLRIRHGSDFFAALMLVVILFVPAFRDTAWADDWQYITITKQPKDVTVKAGQNASFYVIADGSGDITFQWESRKDANSPWTKSAQPGAKTNILSVDAVGGLSGWQFRCTIRTSKEYKTTDVATLTVLPAVTKQPADAYAPAGSTAKFTVTASGKANLTYQWQSRKDSNSAWSNSGQSGAKTQTLSVAVLEGLNRWQFRCVVTDGNGNKTYSDPAVLLTKFGIIHQPMDKKARAGTQGYFTISAVGKGTLKYQWQSRKNSSSAWSNSGQTGAKTSQLCVSVIGGLNGWQFRCIVTDASGKSVTSNVATLTVVPDITKQPQSVYTIVGSSGKFTIEASGKANLTYQWQSRKNPQSSFSNSGLTGAKTATLSVPGLAGLNGWQFRCVVTDGNGQTVLSNTVSMHVLDEVPITIAYFPNATFREYVSGFDKDKNEILSLAELREVKRIDVFNKSIADLKGIEFFTQLESLYCSQNNLRELDLSRNTKLKWLDCAFNRLTDFDPSPLSELNYLDVAHNPIGKLDIGNNKALEILCCDGCQLTTLDVKKNTNLRELFCADNAIKVLDLSKNTALIELGFYNTLLTSLNLSANTNLLYLSCNGNALESLDLSKNTKLVELVCNDNPLTVLDLRKNTELMTIHCDKDDQLIGVGSGVTIYRE
ncbi:MAG: hypothetical protein IKX10_04385 [Lachnospiraceae bacterium]|nr:hypothetical protein [Lachnospiraceae bacterium]